VLCIEKSREVCILEKQKVPEEKHGGGEEKSEKCNVPKRQERRRFEFSFADYQSK
jgi:hypothetical protein